MHCVHIKETETKKRETNREIQRVTERHLCKLALYIVLPTLPCFFVSLLLAELWRRSVHVSIFYRLMPNSPYTSLHWDVQCYNVQHKPPCKKETSSLSYGDIRITLYSLRLTLIHVSFPRFNLLLYVTVTRWLNINIEEKMNKLIYKLFR